MCFNKEARAAYLKFALPGEAKWTANFRDLAALSPIFAPLQMVRD